LVQQIKVVAGSIGDRSAARRVRAGAIDEERHEHRLVLGGRHRPRTQGQGRGQEHTQGDTQLHGDLLVGGGELRTSVEPFIGLETRYGKGHIRSFSFVTCHSRASPLGSTIRKKTMRPPNTISSISFWSAVGILSPSQCGMFVSRMGVRMMKPVPRNEPRIEPSPPMMIMKRTRKD